MLTSMLCCCLVGAAFPYFHEKSKTSSEVYKQKYHLIGVLVHGVGSWVYTMADRFKSDSNVTIEVLQRVLAEIEAKKGRLPRKLYLQMDNCTRENKNKYVLGYLSWLVQRGVFDEIELSFLPVGHTHEDIDQMFSRIAIRLRQRDAVDQVDLFATVRESFQKYGVQPECRELDSVANMSAWLEDYLNEIHNHANRSILHYQILAHEDGAMLKTRGRSTHPWGVYATRSTGFHLLKVGGLDGIPDSFAGLADVHKPPPLPLKDNSKIVPRIKNGLIKMRETETRLSLEAFDRLEASLSALADLTPIPFNWPRDGKFACERPEEDLGMASLVISEEDARAAEDVVARVEADLPGMLEEEIDLTQGLLQSKEQFDALARQRTRTTAAAQQCVTRLERGNFIVLTNPNPQSRPRRRFHLGRVLHIDRRTGAIEFQWLTPYKVAKGELVPGGKPSHDLDHYVPDFEGKENIPVGDNKNWASGEILFCFKELKPAVDKTGTIPPAVARIIEAHFDGSQPAPTRTLDDRELRGSGEPETSEEEDIDMSDDEPAPPAAAPAPKKRAPLSRRKKISEEDIDMSDDEPAPPAAAPASKKRAQSPSVVKPSGNSRSKRSRKTTATSSAVAGEVPWKCSGCHSMNAPSDEHCVVAPAAAGCKGVRPSSYF
jgi:hypothetical protein